MSDAGRQSVTDKVSSSVKPNSEKSVLEQGSDSVKGALDSAASTVQPQSEKSTSQKVTDSVSSNSNQNDESLLTSAKKAVGLQN